MKAIARILLIVFALQAPPAKSAYACGDKFLVQLDQEFPATGMPLGFAPHRATILVFRARESGRVPPNSDIELLRRVGHNVHICDTAKLCTQAVTGGAVQIVLIDYRDLAALGIDPDRTQAQILPVVSKASRGDKQVLKERYGTYFDSAAPPGKLLAMVDRMLANQKPAASHPGS